MADDALDPRDHRRIGKDLGLFAFSDTVGKGLPMWTEKGATIRRELERFIVDEEIKRGYHHVITPEMAKLDLYQKSGHYPYYKDSMYAPITIDEEQFMLRPMTCPHHFELYLSTPHSYRELPIRIAELSKLYRYELSGVLTGLTRTRGFCLSDAHIICANIDQAKKEISGALDLIEFMAEKLRLKHGDDFWYRLSLGDRGDEKKYYKDDASWEEAEQVLREVLQERGAKFIEAANEAAFYGPKIDIQMRDVRGKEDTAFTVQYDFVMPKRFQLVYTDSDGKEKEVIVVHRSSVGSIERIIAFLIEKYEGAFPLWLAPIQVKVLPIGESHREYAQKVASELRDQSIRVEVDDSDESLGKKIRQGKMEKVPYLVVIGDNEVKNQNLTIEGRTEKLENVSLSAFLSHLQTETKNKS